MCLPQITHATNFYYILLFTEEINYGKHNTF